MTKSSEIPSVAYAVHNPIPIKSSTWVLVNECRGEWSLTPQSLLIKSPAQLRVVGRMYNWQKVLRRSGGVSTSFLKSNDSTLSPLKDRGLVTQSGAYYKLTNAGVRAYQVTYWHRNQQLEARRKTRRKYLENRRKEIFQGSLTRRS